MTKDWMDDLSPELAMIGAIVDAQPQPVREAFQYCLALMMVESNGAKLVKTIPGDEGTICHFETVKGEPFLIKRPSITAEQENDIIGTLHELMDDEGLL